MSPGRIWSVSIGADDNCESWSPNLPMVRLPDLLSRDLDVVFCGINPALNAARVEHHFSSRSKRFSRVLHLAGFTPHLNQPESDCTILQYGCGLTAAVENGIGLAEILLRTSQWHLM